jgi:hypothetical protein
MVGVHEIIIGHPPGWSTIKLVVRIKGWTLLGVDALNNQQKNQLNLMVRPNILKKVLV